MTADSEWRGVTTMGGQRRSTTVAAVALSLILALSPIPMFDDSDRQDRDCCIVAGSSNDGSDGDGSGDGGCGGGDCGSGSDSNINCMAAAEVAMTIATQQGRHSEGGGNDEDDGNSNVTAAAEMVEAMAPVTTAAAMIIVVTAVATTTNMTTMMAVAAAVVADDDVGIIKIW